MEKNIVALVKIMNRSFSITQSYLNPGDMVDIIAPSSKCHFSVLEKTKDLVESWGLRCHIPTDLFGDSLLYANSDENRFNHLHAALTNETSKAVWCLLGGFGATKILPMLNKIKRPAHNKIFIGFSDITALHIFLQTQWDWPTIHGPSGYQASLNKVADESVNILKRILFKEDKALSYNPILPLNDMSRINSVIYAPIIGGNLHILQTTLATPWQINAENKILFIEDINERAYRIDRVLAHLSHAGIFENTKAILLGDFIDKGEPNGEFLVMKTLFEFAAQCQIPVLQIKNIGHGAINNPLILGSPAKLTTGEHSALEFSFD